MNGTSRGLCRKYWIEGSMLLVACAIGVFSFCWFRVWIVGELDTAQFRQIMDLLPNNWRKFASVDFDWLVSYIGRTSLTLDEPMLVLFISLWCIVRQSDVVSGELNRGTMEMLLAQPVSRKKIYWAHTLYTCLGLLLLVLLAWAGMAFGIWTTSVQESTYPEFRIPIVDYRIPLTFLKPQIETVAMASQVDPLRFLPGIMNLLSVGFFLAGFSAWCSSWDRYRWRTLGIVIGFYFVSAMMKVLGMASETMAWIKRVSFFSFYTPATSIEIGCNQPGAQWWVFKYNDVGNIVDVGPLANLLILVGLGIIFYVWGERIFQRRDLPAPI